MMARYHNKIKPLDPHKFFTSFFVCIVYYYFILFHFIYHRCRRHLHRLRRCWHHSKFREQANAWKIYWRLVNILKLGLFAIWNVIRCARVTNQTIFGLCHIQFYATFYNVYLYSLWIDVHTNSYCFISCLSSVYVLCVCVCVDKYTRINGVAKHGNKCSTHCIYEFMYIVFCV